MRVVTIGLNHKTAPVSLREAVSVSDQEAAALLVALASPPISEAAVLSTCNRTEFYLAAESPLAAERAGIGAFQSLSGSDGVRDALYVKTDKDAAKHLFAVSGGLDSLIVGESQVLGQVRQAIQTAKSAGTAGPYLSQLFNQAVRAGKRVRSETLIGEGAASVSYAAVELAKKIFDDLSGKRVLLVGAGKMAELAAKNLAEQGVSTIYVANRSAEHAARLARLVGGESWDLGELARLVPKADIVITSTGARSALLSRRDIAAAMHERRGRPLFLIDIAVPRDIEESAGDLSGVFLYNIDDLRGVVDKNLEERRRHVADAEKIVAEEAERYAAWMDERRAAPVIKALRQKVYQTAESEVARVLRRLDHLPEREKEQIRSLARAITGKLLHEPTLKLKESAGDGARNDLLDLVGELFNLDVSGDDIGRSADAGRQRAAPAKGLARPQVEERPAW